MRVTTNRTSKRRAKPSTNLSLSNTALKQGDELCKRLLRPSLTNLVEALIHEAYAVQFAVAPVSVGLELGSLAPKQI